MHQLLLCLPLLTIRGGGQMTALSVGSVRHVVDTASTWHRIKLYITRTSPPPTLPQPRVLRHVDAAASAHSRPVPPISDVAGKPTTVSVVLGYRLTD